MESAVSLDMYCSVTKLPTKPHTWSEEAGKNVSIG